MVGWWCEDFVKEQSFFVFRLKTMLEIEFEVFNEITLEQVVSHIIKSNSSLIIPCFFDLFIHLEHFFMNIKTYDPYLFVF